ncbi:MULTISPECIES: hypothetical protein [unclassified Bradyrhizobium]|uniref:hypothetical protein n=1 Tax=unclassified Bradyrhizobium TaxID=2631580 RepID=UPI002916C7F5|nr:MULTISPECIES: hypothetical protein [unclassified Bradyrhizobium]
MKTKARGRKKSPRGKGKRVISAASARLKELWQNPEFRERMRLRDEARIAAAKKNPENFWRRGVPDGMRKRDAVPLWKQAEELADRFIQIMKDQGELPDELVEVTTVDDDGVKETTTLAVPVTDAGKAERALREAFVLAVGPSTQAVKIQAINTVLNFTKSKPESKVKLTTKPEAFLDEIAAELDD